MTDNIFQRPSLMLVGCLVAHDMHINLSSQKLSKEHGNAKMYQELNEQFLFKNFLVLPLITYSHTQLPCSIFRLVVVNLCDDKSKNPFKHKLS